MYGKNYPTAETTRDVLYTNIYGLQAAMTSTGTLVALTGAASGIVSQAKTSIAYRYALKELNPFALTGNDGLYAAHNASGELDLYDAATGSGNLTDLYLADRAAMLSWLLKVNAGDLTGDVAPSYQGDSWHFKDEASGKQVWAGNPLYVKSDTTLREVIFGQSGRSIGYDPIDWNGFQALLQFRPMGDYEGRREFDSSTLGLLLVPSNDTEWRWQHESRNIFHLLGGHSDFSLLDNPVAMEASQDAIIPRNSDGHERICRSGAVVAGGGGEVVA